MQFILKENHRGLSDKNLLDDLRKIAKRLGRTYISALEYSELGIFWTSTITRRFGSWNAALVKAGLKIKKLNHVPADELMKNLKRVWKKLGRQPVSSEMVKPLSEYRAKVYQRRYGSWYSALKVFTTKVNNPDTPLSKCRGVGPACRSLGAGRVEIGKYKTPRNKKTLIIKNRKRKRKTITKGMRFDVFNRDNFKCRFCGRSPATDPKVKLHIDHIIPLAKGGSTTLRNLQTLCYECNQGKAAKILKVNNKPVYE